MASSSMFCMYFIATEQLFVRTSSKELFQSRAYSGGARTTEGNRQGDNRPEKLGVAYTPGSHHDTSLSSYNPGRPTIDPVLSGKHAGTAKQAGGPIPTGRWTITGFHPTNKSKGSLTLSPDPSVRATHSRRDFDTLPFLIHATGKMGSWGCITLYSGDLKRLFTTLGLTGKSAVAGLEIPLIVHFSRTADSFAEYLDQRDAWNRTA
jgi:hypothetical protein